MNVTMYWAMKYYNVDTSTKIVTTGILVFDFELFIDFLFMRPGFH